MTGSAPAAGGPDVFAALADPTRRWMLQRLARDGSQTPTGLAQELPISRQAVSRHLSVLEECRLVRAEQVGREQRYHLTPAPLDDARAWMRELELAWDTRLIALSQLLAD